jgi:hypothetical protein
VAEVLRSPLLADVTEQDLYDLAIGRRESLSTALMARSAERPSWSRAAELLARVRDLGLSTQPFEFLPGCCWPTAAAACASASSPGWARRRARRWTHSSARRWLPSSATCTTWSGSAPGWTSST